MPRRLILPAFALLVFAVVTLSVVPPATAQWITGGTP